MFFGFANFAYTESTRKWAYWNRL